MSRAYYGKSIADFIQEDNLSILGALTKHHGYQSLEKSQQNAWEKQIAILKSQLVDLTGHIYFEFSIPRMGKRVDNIVILGNKIFLLEFKIGSKQYDKYAIDQVIDYALDLRNFHEGSHHVNLIPVLIAEKAPIIQNNFQAAQNLDCAILLNAQNLGEFFSSFDSNNLMDVAAWEQSSYKPTPTIIEAAQALYQKHDVAEITRSDAGAKNLSDTAGCISNIIEQAKQEHKKSICFVTGVPGAGKTLAGLNIANQRLKVAEDEHAVFLSGNGPLVQVLQEALARNRAIKNKIKKETALKETRAFIQNIHYFRDEYLKNSQAPTEKVVVFDEAQRAWNQHQTSKFMSQKRGLSDFNQSEPEFLIEVMNRHQDWCVIVCLIGGGQEINTGEAGLVARMQAL
nr:MULTISPECIES: DNA/RNA helicase domain-containing protein [unclassified Neisseria]